MTYRVETFDGVYHRTFNCVTDSMEGVRQLLELCEGFKEAHEITVKAGEELLLEERKRAGRWYETN